MNKIFPVLAALAMATSANANIVTNGGFEDTIPASTNGQLNCVHGQGQCPSTLGSPYRITGWSGMGPANNYDFIFGPGAGASGTTADTTGATGIDGLVKLWGPGDGSANGLTLSPDGGNFLAVDPSYRGAGSNESNPITQLLTGLTPGKEYAVTFWYAGAEQEGPTFTSPTDEGWMVGFGTDPTQSTGLLDTPGKGFTGWNQATFDFKATGATDLLSFVAYGGKEDNAAIPPFALLDGVSVSAVPEPATWAMMLTGFFGLGGLLRARGKRQLATV